MKDLKGRLYATVAQVKTGTKIEHDSGFDCLGNQRGFLTVQADKDGLFIPCQCGRHGLDGQLSDDGTFYVGIYLAD